MVNGILNVYKEKGYTSHDVVAKLRGIVGQKKIGHTGTLDPDAEGVLPVCLGRATKVCDMLTEKDKTYEAVLLLGKETDTQDISGTVLRVGETEGLTQEQVKDCVMSFVGEYDQIPPMYSALKVNGKKLYELAREGKTIERKSRKVEIKEIRILEMALPRVRMEVSCSKGTYIRTLCHDIGEKLGCFGCMESLLRTKVSRFEIESSLKLSEIQKKREEGKLSEIITPLDAVFFQYPAVTVKKEGQALAYNGNEIPIRFVTDMEEEKIQEWIRVYDLENHFIGIFCFDKNRKKLNCGKDVSGSGRNKRMIMQYVTDLSKYQTENRTAVTLGKFDGLHRGHQELISRIQRFADQEKAESVVFAFDMGKEALMTGEEKKAYLEGCVDTLIICPFTEAIREMEAEEFIERS